MMGGHAKQSESNTTFTSLSASASASAVSADWPIAPPLRNVRVDTQYVGINEEHKQQIRQLHEELALVNCVCVRYPLSSYVGIWREMHLEVHASGNACVLEVDPKSQLPYVWKRMCIGS